MKKYRYYQKRPGVIRRTFTNVSASLLILANSVGVSLPLFLTQRAFAATTISVCDSGCDYPTIPAALAAAADGDTIEVSSDQTIASTIVINKAVTLAGTPGVNLNTSGSNNVLHVQAAGVTVSGFDFLKSDTANQDIIWVQGNNATITNNNFVGNWNIGDSSTVRGLVVSTSSGLSIDGNLFQNLRQPAYINDNTSGTISNNFVTNTKGWVVLSNTNLSFTGNTWGTNVLDIAIIPAATNNYPDATVVQMSDNNNDAVVENQFGTKRLSDVYVAPALNGNSGDEGSKWNPYASFSGVVARAVEGATVHIADGAYTVTTQVVVNKKLHFKGGGATDIATSGGTKLFLITASGTSIDKLNITKTDNVDQNIIGIQANDVSVTNSNFVAQYTLAANTGTTRALEISTSTGTNLTGNSFNNIRQPAYINDHATGVINNNTANETRGWVIVANTDFSFSGNSFGTNAVDIAFIPGTPNNYPCEEMAAISAANDNAVIDNQALTTPCPPANSVVTVTNMNTQGWAGAIEAGTGSSNFETGPDTAPLGTGSLELSISGASDSYIYARGGFEGIRLDKIALLSYSTYKSAGNHAVSPALQINIDNNVTDADTSWKGRLVYEPYLANGGSVPSDAWQNWNALTGAGWFFSNGGLAGTSGCAMATPCTWAQVRAAFPNAGVNQTQGFVMFKVGSGWTDGFTGNVDKFNFATNSFNTTYDFEPAAPNTAPVVTFEAPTPDEGSTVSGTITPHVLATDDYGMGSYYIRLWKGAFESGIANLVYNDCSSAPGAFNLGTSQDITCPSIDTTALDNGTYVLSAQFQDGHIVWGQALRTFTVDNTLPDTTPPDAPVHEYPADNAVINFNDFWFEWSDVSDAVSYETQYSQNPAVNGSGAFQNVAWTGDYQNIQPTESKAHSVGANGTWYWQVRAVDAAGNKSTWTSPWKLTIDMEAPSVPNTLGWASPDLICGGVTNSFAITATWGASSGAAGYEYWVTTPARDASNAWTTTVGSNQYNGAFTEGEGVYTFKVRAYDAASNYSGWSATCEVTYDATAPAVPVHDSPSDGTIRTTANQTSIDWNNVTDASGVTYLYQSSTSPAANPDGSFVSPAYTSGVLSDSEIPTPGTPEGTYYWHVKAVDSAGNQSAWSNAWTIIIDNTAPVASIAPQSNVEIGDIVIPDVTASDASPIDFAWLEDLANPERPLLIDNIVAEPAFAPTVAGAYNFTLFVVDNAGNMTSVPFSFIVNPAPTIITPTPPAVAGVSVNTPNGNQSANGNASTTGRNNAASRNSNSNGNGNANVLAAETDIPSDADTDLQVQAELDEARDVAANGLEDEATGCSKILGLCWYYWIPTAIAVILVLYLIFRPKNQE